MDTRKHAYHISTQHVDVSETPKDMCNRDQNNNVSSLKHNEQLRYDPNYLRLQKFKPTFKKYVTTSDLDSTYEMCAGNHGKSDIQLYNNSDLGFPHYKAEEKIIMYQKVENGNKNKSTNTILYPDILVKTVVKNFEVNNCPDLLGHINELNKKTEKTKYHEIRKLCCNINTTNAILSTNCGNDSLNCIPENIIGDFGREVEDECGNTVSGYKKLANKRTKNEYKVVDAELSKSFDTINYDKHLSSYLDVQESNRTIQKYSKLMSEAMENIKVDVLENKYHKSSYDDKQLPPVGFDYKCCGLHEDKRKKRNGKYKVDSHDSKTPCQTATQKFLNISQIKNKKFGSFCINNAEENRNGTLFTNEIEYYNEIIRQKEMILKYSRYSQLSPWATHLQNSSLKSVNLVVPSELELFEAYKMDDKTDFEKLHTHLQLVKEIEKKRRTVRAQTHKRLALTNDEKGKIELDNVIQKDFGINNHSQGSVCRHEIDIISDTESCSSDSETCPTLSKNNVHMHDTSGINFTMQNKMFEEVLLFEKTSTHGSEVFKNDVENNFFTHHAKLQIEARIALAQAKKMAHLQMKMHQHTVKSILTEIIQRSLNEANIRIPCGMRRISRQMLTEVTTPQLRIIVNLLLTEIDNMNTNLVDLLMIRDDLNTRQDTIFSEVSILSEYIGKTESSPIAPTALIDL